MNDEDRVKFGIVENARRVWAIGAIHGSRSHLAALHTLLEGHFKSGDKLVYLGNYLGRARMILPSASSRT